MKPLESGEVQIFAIWEHSSREDYEKIETNIRSDGVHFQQIKGWYEKYGGRDFVYKEYILEVRDEKVESAVP